MTVDFAPPRKIPERKPNSEAGCIFENFTPKQGNSLKILVAGTHNHKVSLPPPPPPGNDNIKTGSQSRIQIKLISIDLSKDILPHGK